MDHTEALKIRAAERYLLKELQDGERDAFEEHYFSCQDCAEELRTGSILMANLNEVVNQSTVIVPLVKTFRRKFQFQWLSPAYAAFAIVLLLAITGYQSLVTIPRLQHELHGAVPQALTSLSLLPSISRGATLPSIKVAPDQPFGLYLDIPSQSGVTAFLCEVRTGSKVEFAVSIPEKQANDTVHLLVPGHTLAAGRYDLVVRGVASTSAASNASDPAREIIRYSFQVEDKQ